MSDKAETSHSESSLAREDEDFLASAAPPIPLPALPESGGQASFSEIAGEEPPPLPPPDQIYWNEQQAEPTFLNPHFLE